MSGGQAGGKMRTMRTEWHGVPYRRTPARLSERLDIPAAVHVSDPLGLDPHQLVSKSPQPSDASYGGPAAMLTLTLSTPLLKYYSLSTDWTLSW
ncbi:hypothetical protein L484_007466 [Morus notabilis]|uniref:Uncharacterized protein n=1 Tax=Morus notabilis TaxID=981085 RepID=W9SA23_9ROSA|nr:hypothetical protein L484_007466 [Morus notabilis]